MNKIQYLDKLYYKIGNQKTDFELQIQNQDGFMSKRRKYSDIGFSKDEWWLEKVNARTIMVNEIVLDLDPFPDESKDAFKERINKVKEEVLLEHPDYWGMFQSNRGIHIHLWYNKLFSWSEEIRKKCRIFFCKKYGADIQKTSERVTISLGLAVHWKSGKIKDYIKGNLFDEDEPIEKEYPLTERQKELLKKFADDDPFSKPDFKPKTFYELGLL